MIQLRAKQTARLLPYDVKWALFKQAWAHRITATHMTSSQCITIARLFLGQQEKKYQKLLLNQSVYSKTVHPRKIFFTESRGSSRFCSNKVVSDFEFRDFLSKGRTNFNCVFWYFFSRWPKNKRTILIKQVMHCEHLDCFSIIFIRFILSSYHLDLKYRSAENWR